MPSVWLNAPTAGGTTATEHVFVVVILVGDGVCSEVGGRELTVGDLGEIA